SSRPISPLSSSTKISIDGDPNGPLHGEVVAVTGALTIPRREAAELAARLGCSVASNVTKNTTLLVVGDLDIRQLSGHKKSSKQRRAEELIDEGFGLRIICETDFRRLVSLA
ncbi:BRCT domain-containing protein, partial [Roseicyclus sp.]|uniref:BRCT domain-containing protein n=1 Tax=Roseicyclus sp. TaxID=1914329 RepID=UPI003F6A67E4